MRPTTSHSAKRTLAAFLHVFLLGALAAGRASAQTTAPVPVQSLTLRSGSVAGSARDPGALCWKVPSAGITSPLTAAQFASARAGFPAFVLTTGLPSQWISGLTADPAARWINEIGSPGSGNSVLYAVPFTLEEGFDSATLEFDFAADNLLGFSPFVGLYLNEQGIPNSAGGTHEQAAHWLFPSGDVTPKLHPGLNYLYILSRDTGLAGGLLFSARIRTYRAGVLPILDVAFLGDPVLRNGRTGSYSLEIRNTSNAAVDAALVCIVVDDTLCTLLPLFTLPPLLPTTGGPAIPTVSSYVEGNERVFSFLVTGIPAATTLRAHAFEMTFQLQGRDHAQYRIRAMALPLDSGLGLPCVRAVLDEAISSTIGDISAVGCVAAGFSTSLLDELGTGSPLPTGQRAIEDLGAVLGDAARDCGVDAIQSAAIERLGGKAASRVVATLTGLCTAAGLLHECVDPRIQSCDQIWNQAMSVFVGRSIDPNSIVGPVDEAGGNFVNPEHKLSYRTNFENLPTATLAAQIVSVVHRVPNAERLDWNTLRYERLILGRKSFDLRQWDPLTVASLDLRPEINLIARVQVSASRSNGTLVVFVYGVDPVTGLIPNDARGILPPNVHAPEGEAALQWSVMASPGLRDGDELAISARITFDGELPIDTNLWTNRVDGTPPMPLLQQVSSGPDSMSTVVVVSGADVESGLVWQGIQATSASGVRSMWGADTSGRVLHHGVQAGATRLTAVARDAVGHTTIGGPAQEARIWLPWLANLGVPPAVEPGARWSAYPSPVRDGVLRFAKLRPGQALQLRLLDVTGRHIASYDHDANAAGEPAPWVLRARDGSPLPAGIYYLTGRAGSMPVSQRVVVLH